MRKFLILLAVPLIFSCNSPEKKAQKAVHRYLMETLDDPSRYEPVSWGELDSVINTLKFDESGKLVEGVDYNTLHIDHTYRAPNKMGGLELYNKTFYMDKDFTNVRD